MTCPLCDPNNPKNEPVYRFPNILRDLGVNGDKAHPLCVLVHRNTMIKRAEKRGVSLEQLVASQRT